MTNEYEGYWLGTYTGKKFHYLNPQPDEIDIVDIAHHLSLICRFTGACITFYSVAEHSIRAAELLPERYKLAGLLHDAAEAYTGDLSRMVKYTHRLDTEEQVIAEVIAKKFKVSFSNPEIKDVDNILLATEARDLMNNTDGWLRLATPIPYPYRVKPMRSTRAEKLFLKLFYKYEKRKDE